VGRRRGLRDQHDVLGGSNPMLRLRRVGVRELLCARDVAASPRPRVRQLCSASGARLMRGKGAGAVYQRGDGYWCAAVSLPREDGKRRRKVKISRDRSVVEAFLAEWQTANPVRPVLTRAEYMEAARAKGTHTVQELNAVEDHIIPVALGGSDAIDNIQIICWACNQDKGSKLDFEYTGERPRPFSALPSRRDALPNIQRAKERARARQR
jgi:5-methylcytosine-specific restriction endonuclease McrA